MRTLARAFILFCGAYALDFGTSALFIGLGYGPAEMNLAQRALLSSPSPSTLVSWLANQDFRIALLAAGLVALSVPRLQAERFHMGFILGLGALLSLYGVAANVAFTLQAVAGVSLPVLECYGIASGLALLTFKDDFRVVFRRF